MLRTLTRRDKPPDDGRQGFRYCRDCRGMQPLSEFPAGPRRFFCRKHLYRRCTLPAKKRIQADDKRRLFNQLWARCSRDSKALGQTRIQLDQREIAEIVEDRGIDNTFAIVPANASQILSRENFAVVFNAARRDLLCAHRLGGESLYLSTLAAMPRVDAPEQQFSTDTERRDTEEQKGTLEHILN